MGDENELYSIPDYVCVLVLGGQVFQFIPGKLMEDVVCTVCIYSLQLCGA